MEMVALGEMVVLAKFVCFFFGGGGLSRSQGNRPRKRFRETPYQSLSSTLSRDRRQDLL